MTKTNISERSTDETISELFFEDGFIEAFVVGSAKFSGLEEDGSDCGFDFEDFAHKVRKNAEAGSLVWTDRHIVGTRSNYQFEIVKK